MNQLSAEQFAEFYRAVHGNDPFPWQKRLASRVCDPTSRWPRVIALPTAAGKTTCIEISLFALACQAKVGSARTAPRRIFFVVDRRVVVDQAYLHAKKLEKVLATAQDGIVRAVADALRGLADDERPLDVYALRGGMYRETAWVRSPLQPTVITSTVDQVGSRLLFRGYGVSDSMKPIHAGLIGNDALILLDEAHCARPFDQTTRYVEQYRLWGDEWKPPFCFVSITATPTAGLQPGEILHDEQDDRDHGILGPRINANKPATLVVAENAKGKKWQDELVKELAAQARGLMGGDLGFDQSGKSHSVQAVGVIVNRVATARNLAEALRSDQADVLLLTGRMRPVDRDLLLSHLEPLFPNSERVFDRPVYVVATQCLEVGADLDFHALVTECASLDGLRQRFGRLNRVAARPSARSVVVIRQDQIEDTGNDPVYGASLANTWKWLKSRASSEVFNFGVAAVRAAVNEEDLSRLNAPSPDAPVLFPGHLDCWVQTHPAPCPDPDPAFFLHGSQPGAPDVQVIFRADLGDEPSRWTEIVSLCPPSSSEAVSVPIHVFRQWLGDPGAVDTSSDIEGREPESNDESPLPGGPSVLRWQGPGQSKVVSIPSDVCPGDTLIIRNTEAGVEILGDFPTLPPHDCAEEAWQRSRDKAFLRLNQCDLKEDDDDFDNLLTRNIEDQLRNDSPDWLRRAVENLRDPKRRIVTKHPLQGWVVTGRRRLHQFDPTFLEDEESSESPGRRIVTLEDHSRGVAAFARRFAVGCSLNGDQYATAGIYHDLGKLDPRFQALLQGRSPRTVLSVALAKSGTFGFGDRTVHRYPAGARHELLSAALVATQTDDDLLLHLIATHHGSGRPFANPVEENDAAKSPFIAKLFDRSFQLASSAQAPGVWNPELGERFWRVVRKYGWWGAAFREGVFRLADHARSRLEQEMDGVEVPPDGVLPLTQSPTRLPALKPIELSGLDGSNPLAFLAALGTLRLADQAFKGSVRMSWARKGRWIPVLHVGLAIDEDRVIDQLHQLLHRVPDANAKSEARKLHEEYRRRDKAVLEAQKSIKSRKLRGEVRETAMVTEVRPLEAQADLARAQWLRALEKAVPASFLSLGKALSVTVGEFGAFAGRAISRLLEATDPINERANADFTTAFGCEACCNISGQIVPTEFQLITGSGHQFFLETIGCLMGSVTCSQLHRALFGPWERKDLRLSFRWDPIDDRRYAQRWGDPSADVVTGEHGANLLAVFALPLFPLIPTWRGPVTTGFIPGAEPVLTWPVWTPPFNQDFVRSVLAVAQLHRIEPDRAQLASIGVAEVFRSRKIEVGSGLNKKWNLTPSVAQ